MHEQRKLALRKESLTELTSHEMHQVAGGVEDSLGCLIRTVATCVDTYTVATCTCPTGASCGCPTGAGCA